MDDPSVNQSFENELNNWIEKRGLTLWGVGPCSLHV